MNSEEVIHTIAKNIKQWAKTTPNPNIKGPENCYYGTLINAMYKNVDREDPEYTCVVFGLGHIIRLQEWAHMTDKGEKTTKELKRFANCIAKIMLEFSFDNPNQFQCL